MQSTIFGTQEVIQKKIPVTFTFGNFDGVHLGHQSLIAKMNKNYPEPVVVMTFDPHPANFFRPAEPKRFLTTSKDKANLLIEAGVDVVIVQNFSSSFAQLTADEFCENILAQNFNIRHIVMGYNLSYGKDRKGNVEHMQAFGKKMGWTVEAAPALEDAPGQIISSTRIRDAVINAEPHIAEKLLGRPYAISGTVFRGDQRGRQLGYPTANIDFDSSVLIPHFGVYACEVEFPNKYPGQRFFGVMNCGMRPTFATSVPRVQIETYILNFDEEIYGENIVFHLKHFIRKEEKFGSFSQLKTQMQKDVEFAIKRFVV